MVLSEAEVTNGSKRGIAKTPFGSRNVARGVGTWVIGYKLSIRNAVVKPFKAQVQAIQFTLMEADIGTFEIRITA